MAKIYIAGPMSGLPEYNYMRAAIAQVIQADAIAYLPRSHYSRGARLELVIGKSLGLDVRPLAGWFAA